MRRDSHNLEKRFTEPESWQWGRFTRAGREVRFGFCVPEGAKGIVVALPGLSEFGEKYFEIARECLARGYGFYVIDWYGQGASGRYLRDRLKRHSADFAEDVADLHEMISHILARDPAVEPRDDDLREGLPLHMLAHSMGGNIGLRYLTLHPSVFTNASFSAPMVGIHAVQFMPRCFSLGLSRGLNVLLGKVFTSLHGKNSRLQNKVFTPNPLTSDPLRFPVMLSWMDAQPALDIGDVTFGWVYHALRSCFTVQDHVHEIKAPCLFALGTKDFIVSNDAIRTAVPRMPHAELIEIDGARHELLMESDPYRSQFTDAFFARIEGCKKRAKQAH
ncbi:MAG: alpha/beta fold hydrolase [Alphaproteobacteria bacterium]